MKIGNENMAAKEHGYAKLHEQGDKNENNLNTYCTIAYSLCGATHPSPAPSNKEQNM